MNQDWEEKRIKRLFDEMRQEEERLAPSFARVSGPGFAADTSGWQLVLRFALAAALLIVLIGSAFLFATRSSKRAGQDEIAVTPPTPETERHESLPPPEHHPAVVPDSTPIQSIHRSRRGRHTEAVVISQWRSPTDFLLVTPGDQLLRTVPKLGESPSLKVPDSNN